MQTNLTTTILKYWGLLRFKQAINRQTFGQNGCFFACVERGRPSKSAVSYMILVHTFFFITKVCTVGMDIWIKVPFGQVHSECLLLY